ncbi:hypothetical protein [Kitasatospora sp. NPDC050543]|uniref:hypothetical protein n=1 Tax=Kitasatospora sp. NPDC050543 TaxID=3364054 RepID=UPI0037943C9E
MTLTTIKVQSDVRDDLARLAADDLGGVTLNAAVAHLITEHRKAAVLAAYARLQADPEAWADYENELDEWDGAAGDGLGGGEA